MTAVSFLPPAEEEMIEAARYYESKSDGLGSEFLAEVERTIESIKAHPSAAAIIRSHIRRRLLNRFPFGLLYAIDDNHILILAVMHLRRRPGYWKARLGRTEQ
jgi:plasmid stabilization system protein ParE